MKRHGFLKTFISVCSGTEIFPTIASFPLIKAIGHLILLSLVCASANIAMRYHPFNVEFEKVCGELQNKFGDLSYTAAGVVPERSPEKPESIVFDDLRVDYFPALKDLAEFKPGDDCGGGIVWTPRSIILWDKTDDKAVPLIPLIVPTFVDKTSLKEAFDFYWTRMSAQSDSKSTLQTFAKLYEIPSSQPILNDSTSFRNFQSNILSVPLRVPTLYILYLASEMLVNILLISPMYILVFTMFSSLLGKSDMLGLSFRKLFVIGLYTGVPGTVIAALYTILQLPYLDFQSVFLIAYLVYSFPVFNRLRREFVKENSGDHS
ncbi:MAG: hypothetical protein GXP32_03845 [Kiritimatiellaeota bacterium]|nr:hypothetical protein [Kiritimatiellota bacterium]